MRLTGDAFERVHPFKRFQKKRGGKVGTRFHMTCAQAKGSEGLLVYNGEAMLASWSDSSNPGQTVRLWLDDEAERHPFAGFARRNRNLPGDMFGLVLVELTDDQVPVDQRAEEKLRPRRKLSQDAHLIVTSDMFVRYLTEMRPQRHWDANSARQYVKDALGIESLSDLDRNPAVAKEFHERIRKPYARWNSQEV